MVQNQQHFWLTESDKERAERTRKPASRRKPSSGSVSEVICITFVTSMSSDLVWAVKNGDLDKVKEIVDASSFDVNAHLDGGRSPLGVAADYGQLDVLRYLVAKGADVNAKDKHGISVILAAIWEGHTECVKFLLENGASKTGTAPDGTTYIEAAEKEDIKSLLR